MMQFCKKKKKCKCLKEVPEGIFFIKKMSIKLWEVGFGINFTFVFMPFSVLFYIS